MPILVDTNVISDVIHADPIWEEWALEQLFRHFGDLAINAIIYSELCCRVTSTEELDHILTPFKLLYHELPKKALFLAAKAFLAYRQRGGNKTSPLPDFFIGAHAAALSVPILTRDVTRYQTYFPEVTLIAP
jgi:predicted nucleic acid-binding protein